jgi:hypothetical protein
MTLSILLNASDDPSTVPAEGRTNMAKISATRTAGVNVDYENLPPSEVLTIPPAFARPQDLARMLEFIKHVAHNRIPGRRMPKLFKFITVMKEPAKEAKKAVQAIR